MTLASRGVHVLASAIGQGGRFRPRTPSNSLPPTSRVLRVLPQLCRPRYPRARRRTRRKAAQTRGIPTALGVRCSPVHGASEASSVGEPVREIGDPGGQRRTRRKAAQMRRLVRPRAHHDKEVEVLLRRRLSCTRTELLGREAWWGAP
jgi:hypothetical protein